MPAHFTLQSNGLLSSWINYKFCEIGLCVWMTRFIRRINPTIAKNATRTSTLSNLFFIYNIQYLNLQSSASKATTKQKIFWFIPTIMINCWGESGHCGLFRILKVRGSKELLVEKFFLFVRKRPNFTRASFFLFDYISIIIAVSCACDGAALLRSKILRN